MAEKKIINVKPTEDLYNYLPIGGNESVSYSPKEIPTKHRPKFKLLPMNNEEKREYSKIKLALIGASEKMSKKLYDLGKGEEDIEAMIDDLDVFDNISKAGEKLGQILRKKIVGWSKFNGMDGKPFKFEVDEDKLLSIECYRKIPTPLQNLLAERILLISGLTFEEERGLKS